MSERSMRDIEAGLERDRQALAQSLVALRERVRPANLVAEGKEALLERAQPLVSRLDNAVRGKPMMAAMAGVAVGAYFLSKRNGHDTDGPVVTPVLAGTKYEAVTRWEDEGGPVAAQPADPEEEWLTEARGLRTRARRMLRQIDDAARRGVAPAAQLAKHRAEVVAALAEETRQVLGKGLGTLTGAAREQALQARERAYMSRIAMVEKSREMVDENPWGVGLALAAAGAAIAWLIPQTEAEDRLMGDVRDALADEIKSTVHRETMKASRFGQTLTDALKSDLDKATMFFSSSQRESRPLRPH